MASNNDQQGAPAPGVWRELQQQRGKVVAKGVSLPCCAAFDNNSIMTGQFWFLGASNNQQVGLQAARWSAW